MTVSPGNLVRVTALMSNDDSGDVANVFLLQASGSGSVTNATFMSALGGWLNSVYANGTGFITNNQHGNTFAAARVEWSAGQLFEVEVLGESSWGSCPWGTGTNNPVPEGVSALVTYPTTTPKTRGRKFLGVLDNSAVGADGSLVGGATTAFGLWAAAHISGFATGTINMAPVVVRLLTGAVVPLTTYLVRGAAAYQRRRKRGVGA